MSDCIPWNHPLDIHFAVRSPLGWPKLVLQIHKLDEVFYFMIVPTHADTNQYSEGPE